MSAAETHVPVAGAPRLHQAQRPRVTVASPDVDVEADDDGERRVRFHFDTYQAVRVLSIDLADTSSDGEFKPCSVVEVENSPWIEELRADLERSDETADFLDRSHHWFLHAGDDVVEVVAWEMTWEPA